jgi:hypothetical protein
MRDSEYPAQEFATQLFEALRDRAWKRVAAMYDQTELTRFRQLQLEQFLSLFSDARGEGEDLVPYITDPFLIIPHIGSRPVTGWPALGTIQQFVDLSPVDFLAAYLEVSQEAFGDIAVPRRVAAVAIEQTDLIHVLYRRDEDYVRKVERFVRFYGPVPSWAVRVLSVRCTDSVLAALPNYELNGEFFSKALTFLDRDTEISDK